MPRRGPPSQLKLIPWAVPTPPRGAPKYSLPCAPQPLLLPCRPVRTRSYTLESSSSTPSSTDSLADERVEYLSGRKELVRGTTDSAMALLAHTTSAQDQESAMSRALRRGGTGEARGDAGARVAPWLRTSRLAEEEVERAVRGLTGPQGAVTAR